MSLGRASLNALCPNVHEELPEALVFEELQASRSVCAFARGRTLNFSVASAETTRDLKQRCSADLSRPLVAPSNCLVDILHQTQDERVTAREPSQLIHHVFCP